MLLIPVAALAGFFLGIVAPSRDILVRQATPAESRGKVYGFAYSGLDLGSSIGPLLFGWLMDHQEPRLVFAASAIAMLVNIATLIQIRGAGQSRAAARAQVPSA
jgi:MFS family permease